MKVWREEKKKQGTFTTRDEPDKSASNKTRVGQLVDFEHSTRCPSHRTTWRLHAPVTLMDSHIPHIHTTREEVHIDLHLLQPPAHKSLHKHSGHASLSSKENRHPDPSNSIMPSERIRDARKRKLSEATVMNGEPVGTPKKRKEVPEIVVDEEASKVDGGLSDGYFYCHQCSKRRDLTCEWIWINYWIH